MPELVVYSRVHLLVTKMKFDYAAAAEHMRLVHKGLKEGKGRPAEFQLALDRTYPLGFWENLELARSRQSDDFEPFIDFLEADPDFFRSGYVKGESCCAFSSKGWRTSTICRNPGLRRSLFVPSKNQASANSLTTCDWLGSCQTRLL